MAHSRKKLKSLETLRREALASQPSVSADDSAANDDEALHASRLPLFFLLGGIFVAVLGCSLIVLRANGYAEKVDSLAQMGVGPGFFLVTGLFLGAISLMIREVSLLRFEVDENAHSHGVMLRKIDRKGRLAPPPADPDPSAKRIEETVSQIDRSVSQLDGAIAKLDTGLSAAIEGMRNIELEVTGGTESLRGLTSRLDSIRRSQDEALQLMSNASASLSDSGQGDEGHGAFDERLASLDRASREISSAIRVLEGHCVPIPERMEWLQKVVDEKTTSVMDSLQQLRPLIEKDGQQLLAVQQSVQEIRPLLERDRQTLAGLSESITKLPNQMQGDPAGMAQVQNALGGFQRMIEGLSQQVQGLAQSSPSEPNQVLEQQIAQVNQWCAQFSSDLKNLAARGVAQPGANAPAQAPAAPADGPGAGVLDSIAKLKAMRD